MTDLFLGDPLGYCAVLKLRELSYLSTIEVQITY